jgi:hypothetical protein
MEASLHCKIKGNGLQSVKDTLTQERKACPAIPHSFNQLELIDLTLYLPIGIGQG